jgi:hypothetical protein
MCTLIVADLIAVGLDKYWRQLPEGGEITTKTCRSYVKDSMDKLYSACVDVNANFSFYHNTQNK